MQKSALLVILVAVFVIPVYSVSTFAEEGQTDPRIGDPIRIGEDESIFVVLETTAQGSREHAVHYPDASFIKIHLSEVVLASGARVTVESKTGTEIHTYPGSPSTGSDGPGFWALTVFGDTAIVKLHQSMTNDTESRVVVDRFIRGYADFEWPGPGQPESTCGGLERVDVACYEATHPVEFDTAHAVALHVINGFANCTSWRVGSGPHMMTNEHCITSQTELDQSEFWFNYQRPDCGSGTPGPVTVGTGDTLLVDDYGLDFALFTIGNLATITGFGYLDLDPRLPVLNEEIYIPQHGSGNPKQFGIESDMDPGGLCQIQDAVRDGRFTDSDTGYWCDTIGGSSGSPVLARSSNKVVAIHHYGTGGGACNSVTMNGGVRMDLIYPLVAPYLSQIFSDGFETAGTDAWSRVVP